MKLRRAATVALALALAAACGCDGPYQQFLGAIPTDEANPDAPVEVFLGIDGLSKQAFELACARGAFAGYHAADLITPFPGTSDYSWTRTLRAGALGGYELQYFDPQANSMENRGLVGVAEHPLREGIADTLPAYQRFDFLGDGETWMLDSYLSAITGPNSPPGVCGSCATGANAQGNNSVTRWTRSLDACAHAVAVGWSATWCSIPDALGENSMKSPPRSRSTRNWLRSTLSRMASSLIRGRAGAGSDESFSAASCSARNLCCSAGAVV